MEPFSSRTHFSRGQPNLQPRQVLERNERSMRDTGCPTSRSFCEKWDPSSEAVCHPRRTSLLFEVPNETAVVLFGGVLFSGRLPHLATSARCRAPTIWLIFPPFFIFSLITPLRSDRGSLPCSTPPRSLSRTSPWNQRTHRLPPAHAAASANRRSDRRACRST